MKFLFATVIVISTMTSVHAATSNDTLNSCYSKVVSSVKFNGEAKETLSKMNEGIRDCKESVAEIIKQEREAKKAAANAKKIERLKSQLAKLTK